MCFLRYVSEHYAEREVSILPANEYHTLDIFKVS